MKQHAFNIAGHKLVATTWNPETPGIPVILLHGIAASVYLWSEAQIVPYAQYGPCYALSLPGHYPATFPAAMSEAELTADTVAENLEPVFKVSVQSAAPPALSLYKENTKS